MTSDDQQFLDVLASIPQDAVNYASAVADFVEQQSEHLASKIRDNLSADAFSWLPQVLRPEPSRTSRAFCRRTPPAPQTLLGKACTWISENRTTVACAVAFTGTTIFLIHRRRKYHSRRRRAKKNRDGSKKEVVILATNYHDPISSSVALDLERRGYIVYVTVSSQSEEKALQAEKNIDLQPLWLDLTSSVPSPSTDIHPNFLPIQHLVRTRATSSPSQNAQPFTLAGLILLPSLTSYSSEPLATLPPSNLIDTTNTHLIAPLLTLQQYLPLHNSYLNTNPHALSPTILLATPSIPSSIPTPSAPLETALPTALRSLLPGLRQSLHPSTSIVDLRIGNIDITTAIPKLPGSSRRRPSPSSPSSSPSRSGSPQLSLPWHWHPDTRALDLQSHFRSAPGSHVRELHNAIFDGLAPKRELRFFGSNKYTIPGRKDEIVFVGRGAYLYHLVGRFGLGGLGLRWGRRGRWGWGSSSAETTEGGGDSRAREEEMVGSHGQEGSGIWEKV
ncbi:MAG: hypothetical protein Q9227_009484 [Pyrenula ochraceoflavens]